MMLIDENINQNMTTGRVIPDVLLHKLQNIYQKEFGISISLSQAKTIFIDILTLVETLIEPAH